MNYLQLCQRTASESGTVSGDIPITSTAAQRGRLLKICTWVPTAWQQIQNLHPDWLWMRGEWTGNLTAGAAKYTPASWTIDRFGAWITFDESTTLYDAALGVADEQVIRLITWDDYRRLYGRGLQQQGRPIHYAISPAGEMCFGPIPDKTYVARGEMQKSAQLLGITLTPDTEVPELPDTSLHTVIVWKALILLNQYDEGQWPVGVATVRCQDDLVAMKKYRPKVTINQAASSIA